MVYHLLETVRSLSSTSWRRGSWAVGAGGIVAIAILSWVLLHEPVNEHRTIQGPRSGAESISGIPLRIESRNRALLSPDSDEAVAVTRMLREPRSEPLNVSTCCHFLRLYGLGPFSHARFTSGRDVVDALTNQERSKVVLGEPMFFPTRSGIRYREIAIQTISTGENHRDFCLANFAELGLPLSTPMTVADGTYSLHDLLRDSVENFTIDQTELGWTAIAYALYMHESGGWTNRYGESFRFDDVARKLIQAPLGRASCAGAHLLYAMTILARADSTERFLTETAREELLGHLRKLSRQAVTSQSPDGFWRLNWFVERDRKSAPPTPEFDDLGARLLATGHLVEWLELLPEELQPPDDCYIRAARWLGAGIREKTPIVKPGDLCPCVHAVCSVRKLLGQKAGQ